MECLCKEANFLKEDALIGSMMKERFVIPSTEDMELLTSNPPKLKTLNPLFALEGLNLEKLTNGFLIAVQEGACINGDWYDLALMHGEDYNEGAFYSIPIMEGRDSISADVFRQFCTDRKQRRLVNTGEQSFLFDVCYDGGVYVQEGTLVVMRSDQLQAQGTEGHRLLENIRQYSENLRNRHL